MIFNTPPLVEVRRRSRLCGAAKSFIKALIRVNILHGKTGLSEKTRHIYQQWDKRSIIESDEKSVYRSNAFESQ
jgi:hypothetical protein